MSCDRVRSELVAFHFGEIEDATRASIETHLCVCTRCLTEYLDIKRDVETAGAIPLPSVASRDRLRRAVAAATRVTPPRAWWERPLALGVAAAAVWLSLFAAHRVSTVAGSAPHTAETEAAAPSAPR